jgi:serine/threonine-protein kinase
MVTPDGAKVVDFGIAAAIDPSLAGPPEDEVLGTPAYLAPERLTDGAVEPASDVYALGVLLYRMLSGQAPWSADTTTQMLTAHIYIEPTPLWRLPDVPGYITALCNRCLSKDPTERPSARDAAALLAQGAGLTVVEDDPPSEAAVPMADAAPSVLIRRDAAIAPAGPVAVAAPAAVTTSPRHRRIPLLAAAVLLVAMAAVLWLVVPGRDEASPEAAVPGASAPGVPVTVPSGSGAPPGRPTDVPPPPPGRSPGTTTVPGATPAVPGAPPPGATPVTAPATTGPGPVPTTGEPAPTPTTDAPPQERTLSSAGGTVRATCPDATTAQLLSWSATKPYRVGRVDAGPASAAVAVFIRGKQQIRMTVTCTAGTPSTANEEI